MACGPEKTRRPRCASRPTTEGSSSWAPSTTWQKMLGYGSMSWPICARIRARSRSRPARAISPTPGTSRPAPRAARARAGGGPRGVSAVAPQPFGSARWMTSTPRQPQQSCARRAVHRRAGLTHATATVSGCVSVRAWRSDSPRSSGSKGRRPLPDSSGLAVRTGWQAPRLPPHPLPDAPRPLAKRRHRNARIRCARNASRIGEGRRVWVSPIEIGRSSPGWPLSGRSALTK